ncbi:MAG: hypothetical protein JWO36_4170 [Myxococcales bacterium]|nr:hypothetical protein [Myxococcales bacterium]
MVLRLLAFAPLLIAATAHAQAPGDTVVVAPPSLAPPVNPCGYSAAREPVMAHRWAIGFSVGSLAIAPDAAPDNKTQFGVGELSLRFRATPHLELEAALGGGREQLADGTQGDRQVNMGLLAARYRFSIEQPWNFWLMAGFGAISVASQYASQDELKANQRPLGEFGVGIERRFRRFALQAELRGIGVGPPQDQAQGAPPPVMGAPGKPSGQPPTPPSAMSTDRQSGGLMTIGASYYF